MKIFSLIVMTDILESVADLLLKKGAMAPGLSTVTLANGLTFASAMLVSVNIWMGLACYLGNFLLWIAVLSKIDLSLAFPTGSTSYILVPILSMVVLHERVGPLRWLGIVCIIGGIYFVSRPTQPEHRAR